MFDVGDTRRLFGGLTLGELFATQKAINELSDRSPEFRSALEAWLTYGDVFAEIMQAADLGVERYWMTVPGAGITEAGPA